MSLIGQVSCYNQYSRRERVWLDIWTNARNTYVPKITDIRHRRQTERDGKVFENMESLNMHDLILTIARGIKFEWKFQISGYN